MSSSLLPDNIDQIEVTNAETEDRLIRFAQLRHMGMKRAEIMQTMAISGPTHDRWDASPLVQKWKQELQLKQESRAIMMRDRLNIEASGILDGLLALAKDESTPKAIRAQVMQDLLDRQGDLPRRAEVRGAEEKRVFTDEQFERLMSGLYESARRSPPKELADGTSNNT